MFKKIFLFALICILFISTTATVFAQTGVKKEDPCNPVTDRCESNDLDCLPGVLPGTTATHDSNGLRYYQCLPSTVKKAFGKIPVPGVLGGLIQNNPTGAGAISQFLTNFIILFYSIAAIVLVFMLVWAAFEWLTSGGDKEKIAAAQKRILHAIIGIILFAVAFAIIRILGVFTGFTFFKEPIYRITNQKDANGWIIVVCLNKRKEFIINPNQPYPSPSELEYQCNL